MSASNKILKHPYKEAIIEMLNNGESVRSIESKLKEKYPSNKKLWLTSVTLQNFRKNNLQLEGKVLKDIQEAGRIQQQQTNELEIQKKLESSDAYKKKIDSIVDSKLDVAKKILELDAIIQSRMEEWYNKIASGEAKAKDGDKELRLYIDRQMNLLAQYKKFVEGLADKTVDYNVNITVMNDQIVMLRDAIRECIAEFEPEIAMRFMEKLSKKLQNVSYRGELPLPAPQVRIEELHDLEFEVLKTDVK